MLLTLMQKGSEYIRPFKKERRLIALNTLRQRRATAGPLGRPRAPLNAGKLCCSQLHQVPRLRTVPLETLPSQLAHFQLKL